MQPYPQSGLSPPPSPKRQRIRRKVINLIETRTVQDSNESYTEYKLVLQDGDETKVIWRRYKEIYRLLKGLPKLPGTPDLPPKHIVGNLDPTTVQERVDGFNKLYLYSTISSQPTSSDRFFFKLDKPMGFPSKLERKANWNILLGAYLRGANENKRTFVRRRMSFQMNEIYWIVKTIEPKTIEPVTLGFV